MTLFTATETAERLPYAALVQEIARLLHDPAVQVPPRLVQALPGGGSLFVMPALDGRLAMTKLITFTPANAGTGRSDPARHTRTTREGASHAHRRRVEALRQRSQDVQLVRGFRLPPRLGDHASMPDDHETVQRIDLIRHLDKFANGLG